MNRLKRLVAPGMSLVAISFAATASADVLFSAGFEQGEGYSDGAANQKLVTGYLGDPGNQQGWYGENAGVIGTPGPRLYGNNAGVVTNFRAHSGTQSLRIPAESNLYAMYVHPFEQQSTGTLSISMYVYLDSVGTIGTTNNILLQTKDNFNGSNVLGNEYDRNAPVYGRGTGGRTTDFGNDYGPSGDYKIDTNTPDRINFYDGNGIEQSINQTGVGAAGVWIGRKVEINVVTGKANYYTDTGDGWTLGYSNSTLLGGSPAPTDVLQFYQLSTGPYFTGASFAYVDDLLVETSNGSTPSRPANFGRQWLREHPFTIMAAAVGSTPPFDLNRYMGLNVNTVFANNNFAVAQAAADAGVPWQTHFAPGSRPYIAYNEGHKLLINQLIAQGHGTGWMLPDEPNSEVEYQNLAQSAQWMKQAHPEMLVYLTVFQNDVATLNHIIDTIQPDAFLFDNYPFRSNGSDDTNGWFKTLMAVRQVGLAHQIPFGGWLQSFQDGSTDVRIPSESDTRYNGFTLLTAGCTMLNYYMYDHGAAGPGSTSDLLDQNGNPTALYNQVAAANLEYAHVGKSLRYLVSSDVRFVKSGSNPTPTGLTNWAQGAGGDLHVLGISVNTSGSTKNGLIGYFTDDSAQNYFMLTNLNHGANSTSAQTALGFHLTFDNSISQLKRLNRLTGEPERVLLTNHALDVTLPGGTGDLFGFNFGSFPGILSGDANLDGIVNTTDFSLLASNFGGTVGVHWALGDFNLDGVINALDFNAIAAKYGAGTAPAPASALGALVPEPGMALSIVAGLLFSVSRQRNVGRCRAHHSHL